MRNKALFLATTAVALIAGSGQATAGDMYVSVFGGLNWQHDSSGAQSSDFGRYSTFTDFSEEADTGFTLGATVGTHLDRWAQGLRAEVEVSYRRNDITGRWFNSVSSISSNSQTESGPLSGNTSTFAIMANVWYDIDMGWKAKPYVGGGVGWGRSHLDGAAAVTTSTGCCELDGPYSFERRESGFAWQLGAGVNYEVAPGIDLGLGYRFFRGPGFDPVFIGKNGIPINFDNDNHAVSASLTIGIN